MKALEIIQYVINSSEMNIIVRCDDDHLYWTVLNNNDLERLLPHDLEDEGLLDASTCDYIDAITDRRPWTINEIDDVQILECINSDIRYFIDELQRI